MINILIAINIVSKCSQPTSRPPREKLRSYKDNIRIHGKYTLKMEQGQNEKEVNSVQQIS